MPRPTVLLADDDRAVCTVLSQAIRRSGFNVVSTDDVNVLLSWVREGKGDLVITDVVMPKGNGLEFLPRVKHLRPDMPVIVISANNTLMTAVKAAEVGAFEYFPKPFNLDELVDCVKKSLGEMTEDYLASISADESSLDEETELIGRSPAMQEVYKALARLVKVDLTVMLRGESGTGKELVARTLHALSPRKDKPFIAVNMAALPRELVESELFGHEKGAFTGATGRKPGRFELAEGGTLFLDEIGDMPADAQTKLLRTLQEQEYTPVGGTTPRKTNVRIICATHRDLAERVKDGDFREDLFFRLNVVPIYIPPLRERREDIKALALHCLAKARRKGLPEKKLSSGALEELENYEWPGNVRELENLIYRVVTLHPEPRLDRVAMQQEIEAVATPLSAANLGIDGPLQGGSLQEVVEGHLRHYFATHKGALPASGLYDRIIGAVEKPLLEVTMEAVDGHQLKAADLLGINRNTLRKKLREHELIPPASGAKKRG